MDLVAFLKERVRRYDNRVLLYGEEGSVTYREFDAITDRIARGLELLGAAPGDRVAVLHPNSSQTLLAFFGIIKAGCVVVPINPAYTPREVTYLLNNSESTLLIAHEDFASLVDRIKDETPRLKRVVLRRRTGTVEAAIAALTGTPLMPLNARSFDPDDPAIMFYTSGTTGNPKGVVLTHGNFCFGGPNIAQSYGLREDDISIAALPMVHVFSIASPFFGSLASGGAVVTAERFKPETVFDLIEKFGVTWFPGVPTMFILLLNALPENTRDLSSLRMGLSGGASLPVEVLRRWEEAFRADVIEVYGLTESTGLVTANPVYGVRKPGSVGITVSGVAAKVVGSDGSECRPNQVGELVFRGPNAAKGYFKLPEETREKMRDGWIHTGDHAYRDDDGYFFIVGREKELIISGGYNIYPKEIEEVLHAHVAVAEAAVIGVSDPLKGEVPKAFIVLKQGVTATEEELAEQCKANLAPYKLPKIAFIGELPKNPTGKIMKKELPRE
ncbi:MAG: long-chain fatty acid--CoA ligase [Deltaproteobacteria bacterium]|nr:long-chain fatty acid--CoA ligase [Deltaproteobacteria bacterium]